MLVTGIETSSSNLTIISHNGHDIIICYHFDIHYSSFKPRGATYICTCGVSWSSVQCQVVPMVDVRTSVMLDVQPLILTFVMGPLYSTCTRRSLPTPAEDGVRSQTLHSYYGPLKLESEPRSVG